MALTKYENIAFGKAWAKWANDDTLALEDLNDYLNDRALPKRRFGWLPDAGALRALKTA